MKVKNGNYWADGETLVLHSDDRDIFLEKDTSVFFITEHYANYPYVLVKNWPPQS